LNGAFILLFFLLSVCATEIYTSKAISPAARKLSEAMRGFDQLYTVNKRKSFQRLSQGDEEVELDDVCQELLPSVGIGCTCMGLGDGVVSLNCPDSSCLLCDEAMKRCGITFYSLELGSNGTPADYIVGQTVSFEYTTGETVAVAQSSCDVLDGFPNGCLECVAYVNGEECSSCAMCEDGFSYVVDCENLATNSSFSECFAGPPEYGIFQGLSFSTCQYDSSEWP
jgi:hypothetical protein